MTIFRQFPSDPKHVRSQVFQLTIAVDAPSQVLNHFGDQTGSGIVGLDLSDLIAHGWSLELLAQDLANCVSPAVGLRLATVSSLSF